MDFLEQFLQALLVLGVVFLNEYLNLVVLSGGIHCLHGLNLVLYIGAIPCRDDKRDKRFDSFPYAAIFSIHISRCGVTFLF